MLHVVGVLLNVNQSGLLNQAVYIAIQIAPVGYYILEGVESMLPSPNVFVGRQSVLHVRKPPAGSEHPVYLGQCPLYIGNAAERPG